MLSGARKQNTGLPLDPHTSLLHFSFYLRVFALSLAHGVLVSNRGYGGACFCGSRVLYRLLLWMSTAWLPVEVHTVTRHNWRAWSQRCLYAWSAEERRMAEKELVSVTADLLTRMDSRHSQHTAKVIIIRRALLQVHGHDHINNLEGFKSQYFSWVPLAGTNHCSTLRCTHGSAIFPFHEWKYCRRQHKTEE